jgi:hypothetical protein
MKYYIYYIKYPYMNIRNYSLVKHCIYPHYISKSHSQLFLKVILKAVSGLNTDVQPIIVQFHPYHKIWLLTSYFSSMGIIFCVVTCI